MTSILKADTIQDSSGNNIINESSDTITIGASGDTITIPAGATIANSGTATGFGKVLQVKQQQNYIVLPEFVLAVNRIFPFTDKHNLNMFDLRYQLRLNDLYDLSATNILYYNMVQEHISLLDNILVGQVPIRYKQHMNRLYLDADIEALNANEFLIIECHRKIDPNDFTDIYNDMWLKRYSTALVKYQWGENLSKFQGITLPGGITLDASEMKSQAQEEITKLEEESRLNYELPIMDLMG